MQLHFRGLCPKSCPAVSESGLAPLIGSFALQERTARYLEQLASGTTLVLRASKPSAKAGVEGEIEKITKTVHVRIGRQGRLHKNFRSLAIVFRNIIKNHCL